PGTNTRCKLITLGGQRASGCIDTVTGRRFTVLVSGGKTYTISAPPEAGAAGYQLVLSTFKLLKAAT
ncbi:MAG: hypothetical protein M3328_14695, partial [Chloroflexota bacterium]|nr:hypothetical protein [Chloroflexota bacterium]